MLGIVQESELERVRARYHNGTKTAIEKGSQALPAD